MVIPSLAPSCSIPGCQFAVRDGSPIDHNTHPSSPLSLPTFPPLAFVSSPQGSLTPEVLTEIPFLRVIISFLVEVFGVHRREATDQTEGLVEIPKEADSWGMTRIWVRGERRGERDCRLVQGHSTF